jgi:hypothetical protein
VRTWHKRLATVASAAVVAIPASLMAGNGPAGAAGNGAPQHIFFIMMENHGYSQIIGNTADAPFINQLASRYNVATDFHGVTHPSLPNYLAMFSGDFQGIWDDCKAGASVTCAPEEFVPDSGDDTDEASLTQQQIDSASATPHLFGGQNLVDQLESHGRTWKAYVQSMPTGDARSVEYWPGAVDNGDGTATTVKLYAQKHNPFFYFSDIDNNPARVADVVPFDNNFSNDLESGNVPNFVWISPNQCNDMHGLSAAGAAKINNPRCASPSSGLDHSVINLGDQFLQQTVTQIMQSSTWKSSNSSLVISWDENDYSGFSGAPGSPVGADGVVLGGGDAPLIVINSQGGPHKTSSKTADHYTVLSTIEQLWHLGCLANTCSPTTSGTLTNLFAN